MRPRLFRMDCADNQANVSVKEDAVKETDGDDAGGENAVSDSYTVWVGNESNHVLVEQ